ncbi:holo-[acyl-carrier protein] synthase [Purpureocillium lavendulum]|uniref:Holo-[acyl-carrier protein] synthase n=1 Tax=Purpureocillium lavendulum TaxID=1247861 RepID=A0AB34FZ97_9HYPO|nr:holo-[acyl-carrier protein] synthase [Purpureocillium lavendulum]
MKPLRAFPLPLNVGTDICQISRIYSILRSPRRARFVNRILAPEEVAQKDPRLDFHGVGTTKSSQTSARESAKHDAEVALRETPLWQSAAFLAGRFAAKEAAIKAHSHRRLTFHDVIIERRSGGAERLGSGPPVARIRAAASATAEEDVSAMISISHDGDYATAVCLAHDPSVVEDRQGRS